MELIKITDPFVTLNSEPYRDATLLQGKTYLLNEAHAHAIADLGLGQIIEGADRLPYFSRSELRIHNKPLNVLFLFDGGFGDAISLAVLFNTIETEYNIKANVACKLEILQDIIKPFGFSGKWYRLPVELEDINTYDYIQIRADIFFKDKTDKWDLCIVEELGKAYNVEIEHNALYYSVPEEILKKTALPDTTGIRIGVNFDSKGSIRSYPHDLQPTLINYLLGAGFEIFLLGTSKPNIYSFEKDYPIHDFCGKTTVPELAALITQMDIMLCMDSFISHFSNILSIRTMVLLSTTREGVFRWHKHIRCLESKIECTPCGEVADSCPRGLDLCKAFFHESITPEVITFTVINECAILFNHLIQSSVAGKG